MTLAFPDILVMDDEDATWFSVYPTAYTWAAAPILTATGSLGQLEYMPIVGGGSDIDLPDIDLPPGFFDYMLQNPAPATATTDNIGGGGFFFSGYFHGNIATCMPSGLTGQPTVHIPVAGLTSSPDPENQNSAGYYYPTGSPAQNSATVTSPTTTSTTTSTTSSTATYPTTSAASSQNNNPVYTPTTSDNAVQTTPDTSAEILTGTEYTETIPTLILVLGSSTYTANSLSQFSLFGQTIGPGQTITVPAEGGVSTTLVILPGETSAAVNGVTVPLSNTPGAIASAIASVLGLSKSTGGWWINDYHIWK
jgi:hypothetical protein